MKSDGGEKFVKKEEIFGSTEEDRINRIRSELNEKIAVKYPSRIKYYKDLSLGLR